ncbi:MAG: hypothetical protein HY554_05345 [Elusimicrobia bacterium]|nr:hypothetical protein [Elusimicrobiota bacterium]
MPPRFLRAAVATLLAGLSPGLPAYQAAAQSFHAKAPLAPRAGVAQVAPLHAPSSSLVGPGASAAALGLGLPAASALQPLGRLEAAAPLAAVGAWTSAATRRADVGGAAFPALSAAAPAPIAPRAAAPAALRAPAALHELGATEEVSVLGRATRIGAHVRALRRSFATPGLGEEAVAPARTWTGPALAPGSEGRRLSGAGAEGGVLPAPGIGEQSAPKADPAPSAPGSGGLDQAADEKGAPKSWLGLGKGAVMFIAALLVAQVGVESLGSAMPALVQKTFGDFTVVAQLAIFSSIAGIIGRQIGSVVVKKLGLRATYLGATFVRLLSISALCALLATGHMTLPLMMAFYSFNGLLGGIAITAEASIPPALVGKDQDKIERFWTWEQTLLEILGSIGPIATGAIVASFGFLPALIVFPVSFAASLAILWKFLKIPQKLEAMRLAELRKAEEAGQRVTLTNVFGEFFRRVGHGAKLVWREPVLRYAFLGYTAYMLLNPFLYSMLAPAFGLRLVGLENPELATSVYTWLTGFYSFGGLLGGLLMIREKKRLDQRKKEGMSQEQVNEYLRQSMFRWMKWGAISLAAMLTLAFPIPMLGHWVALPAVLAWAKTLTLPALALIPFGIAQVISVVKLKSFFQSRVKDENDMPDAMGFFGSASLAASTAGLLALKYLFKGVAGFTPFWIVSALLIPLGIYSFFLIRRLNTASAPR